MNVKDLKGIWLVLVCLAILIPSQGVAFETVTFGEDQELTVWGWARNNTGMFLQKLPYQKNNDRLATERTWLRGYADYKMSDKFRFYTGIQFAYEPWYRVEEGSASRKSAGGEYSEYRNHNDVVREAYFQYTPNKKNDIKIGRQIAIWGESLTEPVGDVIHPVNSRYALAFSNIEDSRIPQWMIRSIHDIQPLRSTIEWIVNPLLVGDEYRVNQTPSIANLIQDQTGQRFAINIEDRFSPPNSVGNSLISTLAPGLVYSPFARGWYYAGSSYGWLPSEIAKVKTEYPSSTIDDTRFGFRTSTTLEGIQFGMMYWHTHNYDMVFKSGNYTGKMVSTSLGDLPEREYTLVYPKMDIIGVYMNKQLPWPGVLRAEAIYSPNKPYNTFDLTDTDAIVKRDYIKYMVAYDLNGFINFDWHKNASIDVTFEHVGEIIPNSKNLQYIIYATEMPSYIPRFNVNVSTNWFYNQLSTSVLFSYWPWGNSGLVMPSVKWTPGWWKQRFSTELKYINVYGDNNYEGMGILRGKDMVVLTTQISY